MSDDDSIDREDRTVTGTSDRGPSGDASASPGDDRSGRRDAPGAPGARGVSPDDRTGGSPGGRLYGMERLHSVDESEDLLSMRELRHLRHAQRLDRTDRNSLYELLDARIAHFLETEWPVIVDAYPEYAERVRDTVCGEDSA